MTTRACKATTAFEAYSSSPFLYIYIYIKVQLTRSEELHLVLTLDKKILIRGHCLPHVLCISPFALILLHHSLCLNHFLCVGVSVGACLNFIGCLAHFVGFYPGWGIVCMLESLKGRASICTTLREQEVDPTCHLYKAQAVAQSKPPIWLTKATSWLAQWMTLGSCLESSPMRGRLEAREWAYSMRQAARWMCYPMGQFS